MAPNKNTMKQVVIDFPKQFTESLEIAKNWSLPAPTSEIKNVLVCGLGGSGIGGTILAELVASECKIPVLVSKTYTLPAYGDKTTLLIACSYSGNTEESLDAFDEAHKRGMQIIAITSGGQLKAKCKEAGVPAILIPGGMPPRGAFAYPVVQLLNVMNRLGLIGSSLVNQLDNLPNFLAKGQDETAKLAADLTEKLYDKIPVLYADSKIEGVLVRFRQQINENSKMLCWHHVYPEMNHNELVGWTKKDDQLAVVTFHTSIDHPRVTKRMEVSNEVYRKYTPNVFDVTAEGSNLLEEVVHLIHLGDWISVLLAEKKGIDPVEVNIITHLKGELAKFHG